MDGFVEETGHAGIVAWDGRVEYIKALGKLINTLHLSIIQRDYSQSIDILELTANFVYPWIKEESDTVELENLIKKARESYKYSLNKNTVITRMGDNLSKAHKKLITIAKPLLNPQTEDDDDEIDEDSFGKGSV